MIADQAHRALIDAAIARMAEETGLPRSVVRPMVEIEAQRCPQSLPFLAGKTAHD